MPCDEKPEAVPDAFLAVPAIAWQPFSPPTDDEMLLKKRFVNDLTNLVESPERIPDMANIEALA